MKTFTAVLAAAALAYAAAECPNGCSGNGVCGQYDACTCFENYMGGDCSQRVCPYGLSFVDTPLGDLNHDGTVSSATATTGRANFAENEQWTELHAYSECSGKGSCNRESGECECYNGYTGDACQRTTCPGDCSGHGQCFTLREIASGDNRGDDITLDMAQTTTGNGRNYRQVSYDYGVEAYEGVKTRFDYNYWDADKNQACVCDPGFFGPDCSLRECPRGDDPLTTDTKHCGGAACQSTQGYYWITYDYETTAISAEELTVQFEWTPTDNYQSQLNMVRSKKITLKPGLTGDDYAALVQEALHSFPNNELAGVTVTCAASSTTDEATLECDESATPNLSSDTDRYVLALQVDFSQGPQGNVQLPMPKVWAVNGDMGDAYGSAKAATCDESMCIYTEQKNAAGQVDLTLADVSTGVVKAGGQLTLGEGALSAEATNSASASETLADLTGHGVGATDRNTYRTDADVHTGNRENAPCSNRGLCDYSTGQCACFAGYSREDCSVQAALAM